jgi:holo-[acyl-carrier protein] synthase
MAVYKRIFSTQNIEMTIRTGIDIVDIQKFAEHLKSEVFIRKVFTSAEIKVCEAAAAPIQCYAGKFATKEAFMKAIGKGIRQEVWFTQIEVLNRETGEPYIRVRGKAEQVLKALSRRNIDVSISCSDTLIVAMVILRE